MKNRQGYKDSMKNIEDVWLSQLSETIASESVSDLDRTDYTLYEKCNKAEAASDDAWFWVSGPNSME
jgi:hypothetical protein